MNGITPQNTQDIYKPHRQDWVTSQTYVLAEESRKQQSRCCGLRTQRRCSGHPPHLLKGTSAAGPLEPAHHQAGRWDLKSFSIRSLWNLVKLSQFPPFLSHLWPPRPGPTHSEESHLEPKRTKDCEPAVCLPGSLHPSRLSLWLFFFIAASGLCCQFFALSTISDYPNHLPPQTCASHPNPPPT